MPSTLSLQALNRATLARQLLLRRERLPAVEAIERVLGLQAQLARPPYMALWSRLVDFDREDLNQALHARTVVRATLMRCTLHMVSARDYQRYRSTLRPVLDGAMQAVLKQRGAEVQLAPGVPPPPPMERNWLETKPLCPAQITGCQPLLAAPRRATVAPSGSTVIGLPLGALARQ